MSTGTVHSYYVFKAKYLMFIRGKHNAALRDSNFLHFIQVGIRELIIKMMCSVQSKGAHLVLYFKNCRNNYVMAFITYLNQKSTMLLKITINLCLSSFPPET